MAKKSARAKSKAKPKSRNLALSGDDGVPTAVICPHPKVCKNGKACVKKSLAEGMASETHTVGHPARELMDDTLAVLRVAVVEGYPNACSMLYGSCSRAGKAMGADNMVTYTHADENGASLKASGWVSDGLTDGGEWDRPGRPRQLALTQNRSDGGGHRGVNDWSRDDREMQVL